MEEVCDTDTFRQTEQRLETNIREDLSRVPEEGEILEDRQGIMMELACLQHEARDIVTPEAIRYQTTDTQPPEYRQVEHMTLKQRRRVNLIQGPPGTGKTATIVDMVVAVIKQALELNGQERRVLVLAKTNMACDLLAELLYEKQQEFRFLRVVRAFARSLPARKARTRCRVFSPWLLAEDPDERETDIMKQNRAKLESLLQLMQQSDLSELTGKERQKEAKKLRLMEKTINRQLRPMLKALWWQELNPNVVVCTVAHAAALRYGEQFEDIIKFDDASMRNDPEEMERVLEAELDRRDRAAKMMWTTEGARSGYEEGELEEEGDWTADEEMEGELEEGEELFFDVTSKPFDDVFMDESGQVNQVDTLMAVSCLKENTNDITFNLYGDPLQLEPYVTARSGTIARRLRLSTLDLMTTRQHAPILMLKSCFRMHPLLCRLISDIRYEGQLRSMIEADQRTMLTHCGWTVLPTRVERETPAGAAARLEMSSITEDLRRAETLPLLMLTHKHREKWGAGFSRVNDMESAIAIRVLERLVYGCSRPVGENNCSSTELRTYMKKSISYRN